MMTALFLINFQKLRSLQHLIRTPAGFNTKTKAMVTNAYLPKLKKISVGTIPQVFLEEIPKDGNTTQLETQWYTFYEVVKVACVMNMII